MMSAELSQMETMNTALIRKCDHLIEKNEIIELKLQLERAKRIELENKMKHMEGNK